MFFNQKVIAIIPARSGSKGVPDKNMQMVGGKSLIQIACETAQNSAFVDEYIFSSDSDMYLLHARQFGAVTIKRSNKASEDKATASEVVQELISTGVIRKICGDNPWLVYLQPTSPLRNSDDIDAAFNLLSHENGARSVISVKKLDSKIHWALMLDSKGRLEPVLPEFKSLPRQALPDVYVPNGALYVFTQRDFEIYSGIPLEGSLPLVMPLNRSLDIDSEEDFDKAARYMSRLSSINTETEDEEIL